VACGPVPGSDTDTWAGWNASWTTPTRSLYLVQIDGLAQSRGECGHDCLGIVACSVEPAVDDMLHPLAQRVEQCRGAQRGHGHGHRVLGPPARPVPGWWMRLSSRTEAAPSPSVTTPSTAAATAVVRARTIVLTECLPFDALSERGER
jgi:hypothetical protein